MFLCDINVILKYGNIPLLLAQTLPLKIVPRFHGNRRLNRDHVLLEYLALRLLQALYEDNNARLYV